MNALTGRISILLIALLFAIVPASAQSTRPTTVVPTTQPGVHEKEAIQRGGASVGTKGTSTPGSKTPQLSTGMDTTRVVLSLLAVIVAIFLLRWIVQQFFGVPSAKRSSRAVQVLSRSMIAPRQHVLLLQVGKRVIVVGDSGSQMNPLCEITDQDEIASLVGQLKQDKADPVSKAFGTFFGKAEKDFADEPAAKTATEPEDADVDPEMATTKAELSGLIEKVRSVSKQLGQG